MRRLSGSLFGITSTHQVLYDLDGVEKILAKPQHTLDLIPLGRTVLLRVFGANARSLAREDYEAVSNQGTALVEKMFVNEANAVAALREGDIPGKIGAFVSFEDDPGVQRRWERCAGVRVIEARDGPSGGAVEADLENIIRDCGACIAIPLLYGQDFLDRNRTLLEDFWKFDNDAFPMLMVGIPKWAPIKPLQEGLAARKRLQAALVALYKRVDQYQNGEPVDFDADMSDISMVLAGRNKLYAAHGYSIQERGEFEMGTLWGQNANTQPILFWLMIYIYSTPGLVDDLRDEVASCIELSSSTPAEITSIDFAALSRDCPLFKSTLFETFRLANEPTSIRRVVRPLSVPDGKTTHHLKPDTWISIPHGVSNRNPAYFTDPETFQPGRFLCVDEETGAKTARYGRKLRPWGSGLGICKGRTFAEKEILAVGACILSLWDIEPVGGVWKVPGMRPGTGAMCPMEKVRVVIKRRKVK